MAAPFETPLPPNLQLFGGYTIRLTAVDPTTGAVVSGVRVSNLVVAVEVGAGTSVGELGVGAFMLVPGPAA